MGKHLVSIDFTARGRQDQAVAGQRHAQEPGDHRPQARPSIDYRSRWHMNHRIKDIELLRGIAVLFVLFEHTRFNLFGQPSEVLAFIYTHFGFWNGVDLFFAISGFVIARDLIPRLNRSDSRETFFAIAAKFWVRRAWRLWPTAWLWLALLLVATVAFKKSGI